MDASRYKARKDLDPSAVTLVKAGSTYTSTEKRFDAETGESVDAQVSTVDLDELKIRRDTVTAELASLNELITDLEAL